MAAVNDGLSRYSIHTPAGLLWIEFPTLWARHGRLLGVNAEGEKLWVAEKDVMELLHLGWTLHVAFHPGGQSHQLSRSQRRERKIVKIIDGETHESNAAGHNTRLGEC